MIEIIRELCRAWRMPAFASLVALLVFYGNTELAFSQDAIGFGAAAHGGSVVCHFQDEPSLRSCLQRGGAIAVADVAFEVSLGTNRLLVAANTTLEGRGLLAITSGLYGLEIKATNVVIRNVSFHSAGTRASIRPDIFPSANCRDPTLAEELFGCMVGIHVVGAAKDIWIDHNTFSNCGDICISVWDDDDGTGHPDAITISNNVFRDSFFAIGVGVAATAATLPRAGRLTFYGNLFSSVFRRQPRLLGGYQGHVFNNYYTGPPCNGLGPGLGKGLGFGPSVEAAGELLLEGNLADVGVCGSHIDNSDFLPALGNGIARGHGKVKATGNVGFVGDQGNSAVYRLFIPRTDNDELSFVPSYPYEVMPTDKLKEHILATVGSRHSP